MLNLILLYEYYLIQYDKNVDLIVKNQLNRQFGKLCFAIVPTQPTLDTLSYAVLLGKKKFVKQIMETEVICPHLCTSLTLTLFQLFAERKNTRPCNNAKC